MEQTEKDTGRTRKRLAVVLAAAAAVLGLTGLVVWALVTAAPGGSHPVVFSEIMSSNTAYPDEDGRLCDWIELYNGANYAVSLRGYRLSDNLEGAKYTFPEDAFIPAGGYYLVSCLREGEGASGFALSREGGEVLSLTDGNGELADRVVTLALAKNTSMVPGEQGVWAVTDTPTPGYANDAAGLAAYEAARSQRDTGVVISEVMADNAGAAADEAGLWGDWVELTNLGEETVDLTGWFLTDDPGQPTRWLLPEASLAPGESLLLWADGGDTGFHACFKLSAGGETVQLRTPAGALADSLTYPALSANEAWQRQADGSFLRVEGGTPGTPETGEAAVTSPLTITEIMPRNLTVARDGSGLAWDWIEITNTGDAAVQTGEYALTDDPELPRQWQLPETMLAPGDCLVVYAAGDASLGSLYASFSLSAGEILRLTDSRGLTADSIIVPETSENFAWQKQEDGSFLAVRGGTPGSGETGCPEAETDVYISEVMADNTLTCTGNGAYADWVELASAGAGADLTDWWLSREGNDPFQWRIAGTLPAGGTCLLAASGEGESFRLSAKGETLSLYTPEGALASEMTFGPSEADEAYARSAPGDTPEATFYPTPGQPNTYAGWLAWQGTLVSPGGLRITEIMTGNRSLSLGTGDYYDWVELENAGDTPVALSDYALGDKNDPAAACVLPEGTLQPGERAVILCVGEAVLTVRRLTVPLKLDDLREGVYLYAGETLVDGMLAFDLPTGGSIGRLPGRNGVFRFAAPTPGEENAGGARGMSALPEASLPQGVYEDRSSLVVTLHGPGKLRYTLDGTLPTESSPLYTGSLVLTQSTALRVRCWEEGKLPGETLTLNYILNEGHTLPVLCLTLDPADMFGHYTGIYVSGAYGNYYADWEKLCSLTYFGGEGGFSLDCGLKMQGAGSRATSEKKSLKVNFREAYGAGSLEYDLFGDGRTSFDSLVIRAGEDYARSFFREELFTSLAAEACPSLITQDYQYVALYLNGEFFGIFCLKERLNEDTYADKTGVPEDTCQVVSAENGLGADFSALSRYAASHDMTDPVCYAYMEARVDFDSVIDWTVFEAYTGNPDISGNVRYACSTEDGKWRFCLYDLDWAFGQGRASFTRLLEGSQHYNVFFNALIKNPDFRARFLSRTAELLDTVLSDESVFSRIDTLSALLAPEIPREKEKWGSSYASWQQHVERLKGFLETADRKAELVADLRTAIRLTDAEKAEYFG